MRFMKLQSISEEDIPAILEQWGAYVYSLEEPLDDEALSHLSYTDLEDTINDLSKLPSFPYEKSDQHKYCYDSVLQTHGQFDYGGEITLRNPQVTEGELGQISRAQPLVAST